MVDDVVAMRAARRRLQIRRAIHMRDAQLAQILRDRRGIVEGEILMQLKAIGRSGSAWHGFDRSGVRSANIHESTANSTAMLLCLEAFEAHLGCTCRRYARRFSVAKSFAQWLGRPRAGDRERRVNQRDMRQRLWKISHHVVCASDRTPPTAAPHRCAAPAAARTSPSHHACAQSATGCSPSRSCTPETHLRQPGSPSSDVLVL